MDKKTDKIRKKYYDPLEKLELVGNVLFYVSVVLSFIIPLINKIQNPNFYNFVQIVFLLVVIFSFVDLLIIRLYLFPRAQEARYKDFLSHAYDIPLSDEQTTGYYNNNQSNPIHSVAAQTLENSFYSKNTILEMVKFERIKMFGYFFIWIVAILNRNTDLGWIAIAAQLILSEQLVSKYLKMEWLRMKFEKTYDDIFKIFQGNSAGSAFELNTLEIMGNYEMAKANASITLSSKIFNANSKEIDKEWKKIRTTLRI